MEPRTSRIVVTAVFEPRTGQVVVAGQVLDGHVGVEGLALTVSLAGRSLEVTTGPHGSFGVRFDMPGTVHGSEAIVQQGRSRTACRVH